jgi:hypothetical protein
VGKGEWTNGGDILARSDGDELTEEGRSNGEMERQRARNGGRHEREQD